MARDFGDLSDDDYVAQVLANEARDNSKKYSSEGLGAYMPKKPSSAAPKPNMRFLRHIIRETDNHNAALKRKEEREARDRARQRQRQHMSRETGRDERDRHRSHRRHHRSRSESEENRSRRHRHHRHDRSSKRDRRRDRDDRSRSPQERGRDSHRRPRPRSRSRSRTPESRRHKRDPSPAPEPSGNDSDPLEDIIGPLPGKDGQETIRTRGRGAYKPGPSTIDSHFAKDYDPTLDVRPDDDDNEPQSSGRPGRRRVQGLMTEDDDWELALEALRDRTRWKQKGEERLRQAGFDESILDRWRGNAAFADSAAASERDVEHVKWSRRGEGREWDRGKVLDDEGDVDVKAPW